ncbi:carboxymuconolactone decarboxylase [Achromobacter sp. UMC71]|nr:carboxymuconolactone decarboxylase [Achromobacter sp. UMC71]
MSDSAHISGAESAAYQAGERNRRRILGDAWVDRSKASRNAFTADFQDLITRHAWNDIWGRPALGDKTRRYLVLAMMLGTHAYDEFMLHVRAALDGPEASRLSPDDVKEIILMAAIYCGVPVANHAFGLVAALLRERSLIDGPAGAARPSRG